MRALLDVNYVQGWASCPLTPNGCPQVMSASAYPRAQPVSAIAQRLREATSQYIHEFWADEISVLNSQRFAVDVS